MRTTISGLSSYILPIFQSVYRNGWKPWAALSPLLEAIGLAIFRYVSIAPGFQARQRYRLDPTHADALHIRDQCVSLHVTYWERVDYRVRRMKLSIKLPDSALAGACSCCGRWIEPGCDPILTPADSWDLICDECGIQHQPEMVALLHLVKTAEKAAFGIYPWFVGRETLAMVGESE